MNVLKNRAIIALIILLLATAMYMLYRIYTNSSGSGTTTTKENFLSVSAADNPRLGNLIKYSDVSGDLKRPLPEATGRNVIRLQNPVKLTGFKFTMTDTAVNYRLFIAETLEQILNPRTRTEITDSGSVLTMNQMYNDKGDFEKEDGSPRYTGSCLAIEMADEESSTWPTITGYQIYGLALSAPSSSEYEGYMNLPLAAPGGETVGGTKVTLKLESDADKMVGRIELTGASTTLTECQIKFRNTLDASGTSLYGVNGPIRDRFINMFAEPKWFIYIEKPVLANYMELDFFIATGTTVTTPTPTQSAASTLGVSVYGFTPTTRDIANYKLQAGQTDKDPRLNLGGAKCPSTAEMLNKQVQAQLICEALEYKDKEKNKRLAYERDKLYLQKLKAQEDEIRQLETQIGGLIGRKNDLASKSQGSSIDALEKELRDAETARKQAEDYLKAKDAARDGIQLKFNLDPQFQDLLGDAPSSTTVASI